jgi:hypothetical protein
MKRLPNRVLAGITLALGAASMPAISQDSTDPTPSRPGIREVIPFSGKRATAFQCPIEGGNCIIVVYDDGTVRAIDV